MPGRRLVWLLPLLPGVYFVNLHFGRKVFGEISILHFLARFNYNITGKCMWTILDKFLRYNGNFRAIKVKISLTSCRKSLFVGQFRA
jgi:hypothetical protein